VSSGVSTVTHVSSLLIPLAVTALPQIGFILYLLGIQGELALPEMGLFTPRRKDATSGLLLLLAMLAVLYAAQLVVAMLPESSRASVLAGARFRLSSWTELPAAILFSVLGAAREELLYRAYLYVRLEQIGLPSGAALTVSCLLFAAAHAYQGSLAVALALMQGLLLGAAFVRTRSIAVPTLAHAGHNIVVLALTLLPGGGFSI